MDTLIVYGDGGHAQSCRGVFDEFGSGPMIFLKRGQTCHEEGRYFIAVGDNRIRHEIYQANPHCRYHTFLSRHAIGFPKKLGKGSIVMPGAIIREGVEIGEFVIINSGAIVEHGCAVGSFAHIAPGAILLGDCKVGTGAFVGANATVRQGIKVGAWQFVKAGTVVKEDLLDQNM